MCIAILNNSGCISRSVLNRCWQANPDGAGLAYFGKNGLVVHKELNKFKGFWKKYLEARTENPGIPFLLHFRITTHGINNEENTHPHIIDENNVFCHNGILSGYYNPAMIEKSDTVKFNEKILKKIKVSHSPTVKILLEEIAGSFNKMIFLNSKQNAMIINEHNGIWDGGNWFSNSTYKEIARTQTSNFFCQNVKGERWDWWNEDDNLFPENKKISKTDRAKLIEI